MRKEKSENNPSDEEILQEEVDSGKRVSGEPESNLAAVGGGAIVGAAAGAAIGAVLGGPLGGAVGAVAGTLAGGVAADAIQDKLDPKMEELYWQENFKNRPHYKLTGKYEEYLPAYKLGWESAIRKKNADRKFEEIETELQLEWKEQHRASSDWTAVRELVRDAFSRVRERQLQHSGTKASQH